MKGSVETLSGEVYEGDFRDGMANGQGEYVYMTRTRQTGQFRNDGMAAKGQFVDVDGTVSEGNFAGHVPAGQARINDRSGTTYRRATPVTLWSH